MAHVALKQAAGGGDSHAEAKARLARIVARLSLLRPERITLASGATSNFYFDMKPTLFDPEGATLISGLILEIAREDGARYVGGLEMGAVPIVACVSQLSWQQGGPSIPGFFVRKFPKDHGTRKLVEGLSSPVALRGARVLIVDDVTTKGDSVLKAIAAARAEGAVVGTVVSVVDRLEGARENLDRDGARLVPLTTAADYGL